MLKGIEQAAAFVLFLSAGVLNRPYCQMEIREAIARNKPIVLLHEVSCIHVSRSGCSCAHSLMRILKKSDERFGAFDFGSAHAEAPADLQQLLDSHESLPFRRRGYERGR